ncbi:PDR/VanB family oxidoreductase [Mesobacillus subterraneus]|uniref:PDR/VanB family oxidoreductase n=1 Tax=Mesobacillus subterraneus TaxID=285983 RepID=UPI001CFEFF7C|nr:PDR/VanB family oxidoreductase [Mesobacillus subterraneus]WLR55181.1 PDR/VanB family oxidoreductase [Mesobacillus subterraneus]
MHKKSTHEVRVKSIIKETATIKRFTLQALNGSKLPAFSGGSHITAYLPKASGTLERSYSIFNLSEPGLLEIAVRLAEPSTGGSEYWHHHVSEGDIVKVSYPKNHFPLSFQAKHHVFYAAGIGITPFLSMMSDLSENNQSFELHYAAKSKQQCAFRDFLNETYPGKCHFYFSEGENRQRLSAELLMEHQIGTHVYFCGPEKMIQEFKSAAKSYGYPAFNIHFELFAPPVKRDTVPFRITLNQSGKHLEVPAERSMLDVLRESGIDVPYSCKVGGCGTCEVKVAEGEIDHYDSFLTDEQRRSNETMLSCISRGKGNVLIDL